MQVSRRALVSAALGGIAGCTGRERHRDGKTHLRLSTWGEPVELRAFQRVIDRYQALHPKVVIDLEAISYRTRSNVDTLLAAGLGPDLLRVQYLDIGRYSPSGALIDLRKYLPVDAGAQFTEQVWTAVQYEGRVHALPHHTDTSAILYNKTIFQKLGIRAPSSLHDSWQWDEFLDVARALKKSGLEAGFAVNWTMGGAFRWLNFLYQHGGRLTTSDARKAAIPSQAARETLRWTRSFFEQGLVPPSDSAQSAEQVENLFATGVVGMYFDVGPQALETLRVPFRYGATFLPRDKEFAAELGGNAVGVTRDSKHPEVAADFALFLTDEENMREFVTAAQFLPVRRKLLAERLDYGDQSEEMAVHREQATTVPVELARTVTLPAFHRIGKALGDELDLAFTGGQGVDESIERLARAVNRSL